MSDINTLREQVQEVLTNFPQFNKQEGDKGIIISGKFILNNEFNKIPLYDEYMIEVLVPLSFPDELPTVYETSNALDKDFEHWYVNGELCLGAMCDLMDFVDQHRKLIDFFDGPLRSYFYSASYFKRYKTVPYGERSHGMAGIIEAYTERYNAENVQELVKLLAYTAGVVPYRGHAMCLCDSGKVFRKCHGAQVLKDIKSSRANIHKIEAMMILEWYFKEIRGKGQRKSG